MVYCNFFKSYMTGILLMAALNFTPTPVAAEQVVVSTTVNPFFYISLSPSQTAGGTQTADDANDITTGNSTFFNAGSISIESNSANGWQLHCEGTTLATGQTAPTYDSLAYSIDIETANANNTSGSLNNQYTVYGGQGSEIILSDSTDSNGVISGMNIIVKVPADTAAESGTYSANLTFTISNGN